ncbi:MAG: hypothetical protein J6Y29_07060 [Clostridiales bacterium]|nr:hypothetical protein [Clostridiales bacterium]
MEFYDIFVIIAVLWVTLYTVSFGVWTFKKNNIKGGIAVLVLDVFVVILPVVMYLQK